MLIAGDLRPLYVAWLACGTYDEALKPPVPAGLDQLPPALEAMAEFYELSEGLLKAAAECSPPLAKSRNDGDTKIKTWIAKRSKDELKLLVENLLTGDVVAVRSEALGRIRDEAGIAQWPTAASTRTRAPIECDGRSR